MKINENKIKKLADLSKLKLDTEEIKVYFSDFRENTNFY